jgi:hypothetical protein
MAKATSRSMPHNQKALWMNGFLQKFSISTSLSTALNRLLVSRIFSFAEWYQNSGPEMGSERVQPESARCLARDFVKPDRSREELAETRP